MKVLNQYNSSIASLKILGVKTFIKSIRKNLKATTKGPHHLMCIEYKFEDHFPLENVQTQHLNWNINYTNQVTTKASIVSCINIGNKTYITLIIKLNVQHKNINPTPLER